MAWAMPYLGGMLKHVWNVVGYRIITWDRRNSTCQPATRTPFPVPQEGRSCSLNGSPALAAKPALGTATAEVPASTIPVFSETSLVHGQRSTAGGPPGMCRTREVDPSWLPIIPRSLSPHGSLQARRTFP